RRGDPEGGRQRRAPQRTGGGERRNHHGGHRSSAAYTTRARALPMMAVTPPGERSPGRKRLAHAHGGPNAGSFRKPSSVRARRNATRSSRSARLSCAPPPRGSTMSGSMVGESTIPSL